MDAALLVQYKALSAPTLTLPDTFSTFWLFPSFLLKINAFTMRYEIWKGREKKKAGSNHSSIASKRHDSWFTICTTGAVLQVTLLFFFWFCIPWLTDVSSSQRWVIYSQTNGAVSNYTYLCRFVWFVVVFSDLLFCFRICHCVFWLVIMLSGLLCFLNYLVFYICICVCNLLFCFQNCDLFCTSRPPYVCVCSTQARCAKLRIWTVNSKYLN